MKIKYPLSGPPRCWTYIATAAWYVWGLPLFPNTESHWFTFVAQNENTSGIERPGQRRAMLVPQVMQNCVLNRAAFADSFYENLLSCMAVLHEVPKEVEYFIPCDICDNKLCCTKAFVDLIFCLNKSAAIECKTVRFPFVLQDLRFPFQFCRHCIATLEGNFVHGSYLW